MRSLVKRSYIRQNGMQHLQDLAPRLYYRRRSRYSSDERARLGHLPPIDSSGLSAGCATGVQLSSRDLL